MSLFDRWTMNIVFLDIDGPMIPDTMLVINRQASFERQMSPISVGLINKLCELANAAVVGSSSHNNPTPLQLEEYPELGAEHLSMALQRNGVQSIHLDSVTKYPLIPSKGEAVDEWLSRHPDIVQHGKWVILDDEKCDYRKTELVLVDSDYGLSLAHIRKALKKLGKPHQIFR
jgi:HAD domain in Swiss Army Knife RNA repair proteins